MPLLILFLFIAVPITEIAIFIWVGEQIGIAATIALVIVTAIVGTALLRQQGLSAVYRVQEALDRGEVPLDPVVDGVCLLLAGAFLLTPGLLTDAVGFLLFIPEVRRRLARAAVQALIRRGNVSIHTSTGPKTDRRPSGGGAGGPVIDGEFERMDDEPAREIADRLPSGSKPTPGRRGKSPWQGPDKDKA